MRLAALYDIHSNLPALEAVLREVRETGVDEIVVGGDVLPGPMPAETLDRLLSLDIPTHFITGNCEMDVLDIVAGKETATLPERFRPGFEWVARQLRPNHIEAIESWPKTIVARIDGYGDVLFCHGTPRHPNEIFTRATSEESLLPVFSGLGVKAVVCGHSHMQFDRMVGDVRVTNAGSVGMPFGEPGAHWLLFGPEPELRRTSYDLDGAEEEVRRSGHPEASDFAARYVLNPPSEAEMLKLYAEYELREG
ncbi:MAG: metallophosphoesterase family protein [Fimbriimonadales bacterium]